MNRITMSSKELRQFRRWTDNLSKENTAKVKNLVARSTEMILLNAKKQAPVDTGRLRASGHSEYTKTGLSSKVYFDVKYAPYNEFGTGRYVTVLPGYEAYAMMFKGRGIRQVNRQPHPFLFANYERVSKALLKELNKMGFYERPV